MATAVHDHPTAGGELERHFSDDAAEMAASIGSSLPARSLSPISGGWSSKLGVDSLARRTLGICLLLTTVFMWTLSNFMASATLTSGSDASLAWQTMTLLATSTPWSSTAVNNAEIMRCSASFPFPLLIIMNTVHAAQDSGLARWVCNVSGPRIKTVQLVRNAASALVTDYSASWLGNKFQNVGNVHVSQKSVC